MNTIRMIQYGSTLTDRADGKKVFEELVRRNVLPVVLDFSEVVSLGSSFGDEVVLKLAKRQGNDITILNTNGVIKNSIRRIMEDSSVTVSFED